MKFCIVLVVFIFVFVNVSDAKWNKLFRRRFDGTCASIGGTCKLLPSKCLAIKEANMIESCTNSTRISDCLKAFEDSAKENEQSQKSFMWKMSSCKGLLKWPGARATKKMIKRGGFDFALILETLKPQLQTSNEKNEETIKECEEMNWSDCVSELRDNGNCGICSAEKLNSCHGTGFCCTKKHGIKNYNRPSFHDNNRRYGNHHRNVLLPRFNGTCASINGVCTNLPLECSSMQPKIIKNCFNSHKLNKCLRCMINGKRHRRYGFNWCLNLLNETGYELATINDENNRFGFDENKLNELKKLLEQKLDACPSGTWESCYEKLKFNTNCQMKMISWDKLSSCEASQICCVKTRPFGNMRYNRGRGRYSRRGGRRHGEGRRRRRMGWD